MTGRSGVVENILRQLGQLRFRNLFVIAAALLLADIVIPDFVPFIDELLLGILTMMFWMWRKPAPNAVVDVRRE